MVPWKQFECGIGTTSVGTKNFNEIDWDENVTSVKSNVNNMDAKEMETLLGEQLAHALIATNNNQMESWLNKRKQCG